MAVFLTDGDQRSTLAVVRALGRSGLAVAVGETRQPCLAGVSKYCRDALVYPSPLQDGEKFATYLRAATKRGGYQVIIPMADVATQIVADMVEALAPTVVPIPTADTVRMAQDKRQVICLAQKLGIPCPATYMIDDSERIEDVAGRVQYPVVIKPRWSRHFRKFSWISGTVQYARNAHELVRSYRQMDLQIPRPLVQETICGEGRGVFVLLWNTELKGAFCHRRIREKPPSGGVSVLRESIVMDERMLEQSLALLNAIGWQGVAMVEFKVDQRDNQAKLMEINGRFWGSLQLAIDAGINFPLMLYRLAIGENVTPEFMYRPGVKTRWLLGDLDNLLIQLKPTQDGRPMSRLRASFDFLKFYQKDMHYEVFKLDDPLPGWFEAQDWVRDSFESKGARDAH